MYFDKFIVTGDKLTTPLSPSGSCRRMQGEVEEFEGKIVFLINTEYKVSYYKMSKTYRDKILENYLRISVSQNEDYERERSFGG